MTFNWKTNFGVLGCAVALAVFAGAARSEAGATMSFSAATPSLLGPFDQYNFMDDATVPGGTTPGGGTYNSQAFSDNAGPPGQTFTTPASGSPLILQSISLKGANTGGGNSGGGVFTAGSTWGVRISSVSGANLTPINTLTGIPTVTGPTGIEWFTWTFTDTDRLSLAPSTQYAFEVYSSAGWLGFDADTTDSYAGGTAFNSAGAARDFTDNTTGNLATHLYDRTFHVGISAGALIPGDVNNDGQVNAADFGIIRDNFRKTVGTRLEGDLTGDGVVNFVDYLQWRANVQPGSAAASLTLAVPEPTGFLPLAIAALFGFGRRGRRVA